MWIGVIWFRIGEEVIFVKRVMNIQFSKEFRRVFHDELRKFGLLKGIRCL